jgi:hypothetical protein
MLQFAETMHQSIHLLERLPDLLEALRPSYHYLP